jgi:beta-glucosidase
LSYTTFRYSGLELAQRQIAAQDTATVSLDVQNTGNRAGDEVVQLYVHEVSPAMKRPIKELRAFQRVTLQPRKKKRVTFSLAASDLAYYDVASKKFVVKPGSFDIMVGSSSEDIRLRERLQVKE